MASDTLQISPSVEYGTMNQPPAPNTNLCNVDPAPGSVHVYYVTVAGLYPANSGSSWTSPWPLWAALEYATQGSEVWVEKGTYVAVGNGGAPSSTGFNFARPLFLYGGFNGTETQRAQRDSDPQTNGTILSGNNSTGVMTVNSNLMTATNTLMDGFSAVNSVSTIGPVNVESAMSVRNFWRHNNVPLVCGSESR